MKICKRCNLEKEESSFHYRDKQRGIRRGVCAECVNHSLRQKNRERYLKNKDRYVLQSKVNKSKARQFVYDTLKFKSCEKCGYNECVAALQFDHVDLENKFMCVSQMASEGYGIDTISREIDKCRVLCANCHSIRTSEQMGWYKNIEK